MNWPLMLLTDKESLTSLRCLQNPISLLPEDPYSQLPNHFIILYYEDGLIPTRRRLLHNPLFLFLQRFIHQRKRDLKRCPLFWLTINPNVSSTLLHNPI